MYRALHYLGHPVALDDFLLRPDCALVKQSTMPRILYLLNLAGFGMRATDAAVAQTLGILRETCNKLGIALASLANLIFTDGTQLSAVRYTFDFGCYSQHPAELVPGHFNDCSGSRSGATTAHTTASGR